MQVPGSLAGKGEKCPTCGLVNKIPDGKRAIQKTMPYGHDAPWRCRHRVLLAIGGLISIILAIVIWVLTIGYIDQEKNLEIEKAKSDLSVLGDKLWRRSVARVDSTPLGDAYADRADKLEIDAKKLEIEIRIEQATDEAHNKAFPWQCAATGMGLAGIIGLLLSFLPRND